MKAKYLKLLPLLALALVGCNDAESSEKEFVPINPNSTSETSTQNSDQSQGGESSQTSTSTSESSTNQDSSNQDSSTESTSSEQSSESSTSYNTDVPASVAQVTITSISGYNDVWLRVEYEGNPFEIDNRQFNYLKVNNKKATAIDYQNLIAAKYFNVQVENNNLETYTFDFYDSAENLYASGSGNNSTYNPDGGGGSSEGYETNGEGQYIIPLQITNRYGDGYLSVKYEGDPFGIEGHEFTHFLVDGEQPVWNEYEPLKAAKYFNVKVSDNTKESFQIDFCDAGGVYATGTAA